MTEALSAQLALLPDYLGRHLLLSLVALGTGILASLPLALSLTRLPRARGAVLMVASAIQTIPGLALLALMVPLLGQIGFLPAVVALILYSMLPVLRNAVTGIDGVDPDLLEAGRGLGMSERQLLYRVQLPLAMPVIIAGIRTAAVWVVGLATLSTPVGATSLGNYIFSGLQTQNYTAVTVGCVAAAMLALVLDGLIRAIEWGVVTRSRFVLGVAAAGCLGLVLAGLWPVLAESLRVGERPTAVLGTKTFTEQYILGRVMAAVLEEAGFETRTLDSLGSTVAFDALVNGRVDAYVDYTGTIWANYMGRDDNPGRDSILRGVEDWLGSEHGIRIAARLGFENTYALAMPEARARELSIQTVADLSPYAATMRIGGDYEFFSRPEWDALQRAHSLPFRELVTMDSTLMYGAAEGGDVDVIAAFSTDGRIPAFRLRVLTDTAGALPPYDAVVLARRGAPAALFAALRALDGRIDGETMRSANRSVDLDGASVAVAAHGIIEGLGGGVPAEAASQGGE